MSRDKDWLKKEVEEYLEIEGVHDARLALKAVLGYIDQLDEPEKAVVPQFVADGIERQRSFGYEGVYPALKRAITIDYNERVTEWVVCNIDEYARAWLDGYEVEREPLYYVQDKNDSILCKANNKVMTVGKMCGIGYEKENINYQLTEKEIKGYDERYMAFAVPIEEV